MLSSLVCQSIEDWRSAVGSRSNLFHWTRTSGVPTKSRLNTALGWAQCSSPANLILLSLGFDQWSTVEWKHPCHQVNSSQAFDFHVAPMRPMKGIMMQLGRNKWHHETSEKKQMETQVLVSSGLPKPTVQGDSTASLQLAKILKVTFGWFVQDCLIQPLSLNSRIATIEDKRVPNGRQ